MEIQFGECVGHRGWLIGPKLFGPKAYLSYASSKLCELIFLNDVNNVGQTTIYCTYIVVCPGYNFLSQIDLPPLTQHANGYEEPTIQFLEF